MHRTALHLVILGSFAVSLAFSPFFDVSAIGGPSEKSEEVQESYSDAIFSENFDVLQHEAGEVTRERIVLEQAREQALSRDNHEKAASLMRRITHLKTMEADIEDAHTTLIVLSRDRERYQELLASSYRDSMPFHTMQRSARRVINPIEAPREILFEWPVSPLKGISAGYEDRSYAERFHMEHKAIDIPTPQGSDILAPADGIVKEVNDHGYGYNTIVISHPGGYETVYGHISSFSVKEGDRVRIGDIIAKSGGRPGTRGAGLLTTGPHLHFETRRHGASMDPLHTLLPMDVALAARLEAY